MEITFWGVRGSIASPGPDTMGVGGNTSCIEVRCGKQRIILDAGTGIRQLGDKMMAEGPVEATLLLSHLHWDHIQGLPFFVPAYVPTSRLQIVGSTNGMMSLRDALAYQMTAPVFPVRLDELGAAIDWREVRSGERFKIGDVDIRVMRQNHPGGSYAYRLDYNGRSLVYATDTEHYSCVDPALATLSRGADVLIYDSQYTPDEYRGTTPYNSKVGWGHSTYVAGVELAKAAGVGQYVLFHHDPRRNDAGVADVERFARELFPQSVAAREGLTLGLLPLAQAA
jgi:phosphoribosyl 1,2-cyclic phosphodiesterase